MLRFPETHRDWGRAGLALYGIDPMSKFETEYAIKPVMRLSSKIFSERVLQPHEPIGYGANFYTKRSTRVGVVACGYADGYPRCTPSDTPVAINGARSRVIGRVSMDMMTVDLYDNHFKIGDEVELFGDVVNINELASAAGTIAYEILCNMKRAKRIYVK